MIIGGYRISVLMCIVMKEIKTNGKKTIIFGEDYKLNNMINMKRKKDKKKLFCGDNSKDNNDKIAGKKIWEKNHIVLMIVEIIKMANNANIIMVNVNVYSICGQICNCFPHY